MLLSLVAFGLMTINAQVAQISLEQTKGQFETESLSLVEGQYQFNILNNNVGHDVGFVLVPKGKYDAEYHIKAAYVKEAVANNKSSLTNVVDLKAGEYEYFCPLNPTPKYSLTVTDKAEKVTLNQVNGRFVVQGMNLSPGSYQFEIGNSGIDHEVGFVLVPKGKYEAEHHIKAAYVKEAVANGKSSTTGVVNLDKGEYEYFCPLNPTPKYTLTVQ